MCRPSDEDETDAEDSEADGERDDEDYSHRQSCDINIKRGQCTKMTDVNCCYIEERTR